MDLFRLYVSSYFTCKKLTKHAKNCNFFSFFLLLYHHFYLLAYYHKFISEVKKCAKINLKSEKINCNYYF